MTPNDYLCLCLSDYFFAQLAAVPPYFTPPSVLRARGPWIARNLMLVGLLVCPGFIARGGSSRTVAQRVPAPQATAPAGFFLLSKLDLEQVRAERLALEKTLDEIDRNVASTAGSTLTEQASVAIAPAPVQEAAAAAASGGDPGLLASVASFLFHPIAPLLPIPVAVVPAVALYFFVVGPEGGGLLDGLKLPQLDGLKLPQFPGSADAQGAASEAAVEVDPAAVSALADPNPNPSPSPKPKPKPKPKPNRSPNRGPNPGPKAAAAAEARAALDAKKRAEQIERTERTVRVALTQPYP